ncbi:MAG: hypothetical protein IJR08_03735 [Bacilli bacterium]|nr:hypothetical protein [Bacilli bacterium]
MKNKYFLPIILLVSTFIVSGCGNNQPRSSDSGDDSSSLSPSSTEPSESSSSSSSSGSSEDIPGKDDGIIVEMDPMIKSGEDVKPYQLSFQYEDDYFNSSAKTYNEDLSMLSFGAAVATATKERGTKFFTDLSFENITPYSYDVDPTKDSIGYFLAHKTIGDYELVTAAFRGFNYGLEWTNNFIIGKTGDHEGFNARGEEVYQELQSYINTYAKNKSLKLWINGYSRGGAISNVLSSLIFRNNKINVEQDNMFVYTFEAPASLSEENAVAYENVHNITNKADIIASIPPESYGLKRCGVDYEIYDANLSTLLKQFDEAIDHPEFVPMEESLLGQEMKDDCDLHDWVLNSVFNVEETSEDKTVYANTREQYVDNYQEGLSSAIGYVFGMKEATRDEVLTAIKDLGFGVLGLLGDQTGKELADFIKPYLTKDGIAFEEEKLQSDCAVLVKAIGTLFLKTLMMYMMDDYSSNLTRLISMHYSETVYVLLKNAHNKQ